MVVQLVAKQVARKVYRDAKGRFISKAKYELEKRRDPKTGRFLTKEAAARRPSRSEFNKRMEKLMGSKAPGGRDWYEIAARYTERFEDYLRDI